MRSGWSAEENISQSRNHIISNRHDEPVVEDPIVRIRSRIYRIFIQVSSRSGPDGCTT